MRIELTPGQLQLSAGQAGQKPLALQPGEVLNATVVSVEGDAVSLKTEDGRLFSARLAEGTVLMENDRVELMAASGDSGQEPVLRVVFVEPGKSAPLTQELPIARQAIPQQVLTALSNMNLKLTPKLISQTVDMMKNHSVDAKLAAFFAANGIPATDENIRAMQSILRGPSFGAALYGVAQEASAALTQPDGAATELPQTAQTSEQPSNPAVPSNSSDLSMPQDVPAERIVLSGAQAGGDTSALQPQAGENVQAEIEQVNELPSKEAATEAQGKTVSQEPLQSTQDTPPAQAVQGKSAPTSDAPAVFAEQPETVKAAPDAPQQAPKVVQQAAAAQHAPDIQQPEGAGAAMQTDTPSVPEVGIAYPGAEEATLAADKQIQHANNAPVVASAAQESKETAALKQLLEVFARLDGQMDAQALKKTVEQTPQKLLELQKLVGNTDTHTQEALSSRLNELTTQAKLAEDISRFVFVQVPLHLKEYGSAELYIYKRNQRDKGAQRERTSVVLGLSTQNMGRVEAMLRIEKRDIALDLRIQNEKALTLFREKAPELQAALSGMKYQLTEYKVGALRERTTPLNAEQTLQRLYQPASTGLDIMI